MLSVDVNVTRGPIRRIMSNVTAMICLAVFIQTLYGNP
jgi:hypothetical protein